MKFLHLQFPLRALAVFALLSVPVGFPRAVHANPSGEIVIHGDFQFQDLGSTLKIIQGSKSGIIHWDNFSINANEITQFVQPGSSASVLNRVTGSARSEIMGQLLANGNLWLLNPNGILVGPGARVDVGGLVLSTLDISNEDYLLGGDLRFSGNSTAGVTNFGTINAAQGDVYVLSQRIENHGLIGAVDGRIVLAADNEIFLEKTTGNVFLSGETGHGHILNNGEAVASDILMKARGNNAYAMAVQNNGIARAAKADKSGGRVRLIAEGGAGVEQAGAVNVDGTTGGKIEISSAGKVQVTGSTTARGLTGGGEIVVRSLGSGGGVNVGSAALVDASTVAGKGGSVEIKSVGSLRNDGKVRAASAGGDGGSVLMEAADAVIGGSGEISVAGRTGGSATVAAVDNLLVEGRVDASGSAGMGGNVTLSGDDVELGSGSLVSVAGSTNGGLARIGGGFAGRDATIQNATNTTVAPGAVIDASGATGNGGSVALWADRDMLYRGALSVRGAINGGFAEVSGKNQLTFAGAVNLGGGLGSNGTLLLDPVNVRIAQGALAPGAINADDLVTAWNSGNVVVHTGGLGTDEGNIVIESDVLMIGNNSNSLSFFAHNNITVAPNETATVATSSPGPTRILNQGTGNINLVSGWDGTGEVRFTSGQYPLVPGTNQAIQDNPLATLGPLGSIGATEILRGDFGAFGTKGAIDLNPNAAYQVIIGSAGGQTNLFANNITMTPGDATGEFVQIGWFHDGTGPVDGLATPGIKGDINVYATGNLVGTNTVLPGADWRYLQIGHGGRMVSATAGVQDRILAGNVTVDVGGTLLGQSGGGNNGWFKIGHGGKADGADVRVNTYGNVDVSAGVMTFQVNANGSNVNALVDNYIQIGNGGVNVRGEHAGDITVEARTGGITTFGSRVTQNAEGTTSRNFFQIGHGGFNADHTLALPFDFDGRVLIGDEITTIGELRNNLAADGGDLAAANRLLGRTTGGSYVVRTAGKIGHTGEISVTAVGNITLEAGGRQQAYAQIGHGGILTAGEHGSWDFDGDGVADGDVSVESTNGAISLTRNIVEFNAAGVRVEGFGNQAFVQIGHGGYFSAGGYNGDVTVDAGAGNVSLYGGQLNAFAKIGHGGIGNVDPGAGFLRGVREHGRDFAAGDILGDVSVNASGNVILRGGLRQTDSFAQIGHGGFRIFATDDFKNNGEVLQGNDMDGNGTVDTYGSFKGNIQVLAGGMIDAYAGQKNANHRDGADPLLSGQIEAGMAGIRNFVQIGHGGIEARSDVSGSITVTSVVGDVRMEATGGFDAFDNASNLGTEDSGTENFALIGHGGRNAEHSSRGENPFDGDQRGIGMNQNSVENFTMFDYDGNLATTSDRALVRLTALKTSDMLVGRMVHYDSPIGWQVDRVNANTLPTNTQGTNVINLAGTDTVTTLNIAVGTSVAGTGIPAGAVVTAVISPTQFQINGVTTAAMAGVYTFLNTETGVNQLNIDHAVGIAATTATPTGVNGTNILTFGGSDTVTNLSLRVGSEITGTGIAANTTIAEILSPYSVRLSSNLTATAAGNYTFAGQTLAKQVAVGDQFSVENQNAVYEITNISPGIGAAIGDRLVTFQKVGAAPGTGLDARIVDNTNLFFVGSTSGRFVADPIQEQAGVGRRELQRLTNIPAAGDFTLTYINPATTASVTTDPISVTGLTITDTLFSRIDAALEAKSGTQGSDFFSVLPAADGSIRVQFQGGVFDNANIDVMGASAGVTVAAVTDGVVAGNTSYLFTTLSVPGVHNGPPSDRTNPVFSASLNPEFVEFINTMNVPTNYSLGWSGDITVNAGRGVLLTAAQRRNLETNPYQGNSVLPDGANTSRTHVPESAVRGFAQIGHGGSDSQIDSYLPTAGHSGNISVTAGGALTMLAGDFVRQVETGQNVTVTLFGAGAPTPLTFNNKSSVDSRENYVQIGHGGVASANGQIVSGNITVDTASDVTLRGGRGTTAFALIGHGGRDSTAFTLNRQTAISGNISVDAGGGIDIEAGSRDRAFAMIGHGGVDFEDTNLAPIGPLIFIDDADNGTTQPDIRSLTDTVYRSLLNDKGEFSRNAVGNGITPMLTDQTFEAATIVGNIGVVSRGVHALTGEGLTILGGQKTTAITLNASGDPLGEGTVEGTRVNIRGRFAQIGHGGANIDARIGALNSNGSVNSGNINVDVLGGAARLKGGIYVGDSARIGHGGRDFTGSTVAVGLEAGSSFVGNVSVNMGTGFDLTLLGGDAPTYDINDSITGVGALTKGSLAYFYNPNQDDFLLAPNAPGIPALQTALLSGLLISPNDSSIRDLEISLRLARGALSGLTSATQVRDAILTAMGLTPSAPLASLGSAAAVNAAAVRMMGLAADARAGRPSQLDGDPALDPTLPPGEFYPTDRLHNQQAAMAQIGHGGSRLGGAGLLQGIEKWDGNISVNTGVGTRGRDVILRGGDGMDNFAMIGHGGHEVRAPISVKGNVVVNAGRDLLLEGGDYFANSEVFSVGIAVPNYGSYAQVGHMFTAANGGPRTESTVGDITATAVRDIVLSAGGGTFAHAMIGSGANFGLASNSTSNLTPLGGHQGDINVVSGRDLMLTPSEIREDDDINEIAYEGSLLQIARLRGPFQGTFSFAQIGHGGAGVSPSTILSGDIDVLVGSNLVSGSRSLDKWAGTSRNPNETAQNPNTLYTLGSVSTAATLAADTSRGIGAYAKIGHGDYLVFPTAAGAATPGVGLRSGDVRVATGQDLWAAGMQIGHIDPATSPGASFEPTSSSTFIAVSRNNPTSLGTGRLITDRSVSNYATAPDPLNPAVTDSFFGGRNQSILATSISSGTGGLDRVRIYIPDRRFGRGNGGGAGAATFGSVDSNDMRGRYSAVTDGLGNTLVSTFGTVINGGGYDDPENDTAGNLAGNLIGASYNTVRGSTAALSGSADDNLGDEALATEFTFTRTAEGLPQGSFTPEGGFQTHTYGTRYMIYYTDDRVPPVVTPPTPPPAPSPGGGGPIVPVGPVVPFSGSFVTNGDQGVADRYGRPDELVDGSVFSFDGWRDGGSPSQGYWVTQEPGASSVILPEDMYFGDPSLTGYSLGLPFRIYDIQQLRNWQSGVLVFDPITGFTVNPGGAGSDSSTPGGTADPFGFGGASTTDDEEERRRAQGGAAPAGTAPASAPAPSGAAPADPFAAPAPGDPAMGAPAEDPFASPAPGAPAMDGAVDPFATPAPATPAPSSPN